MLNRNLLQNGTYLPSEAVCKDFLHTATSCSSTLYRMSQPLLRCKVCLDDDAPTIPNLRLVRVDSRSHPVRNVLCNWVGLWWCSLNFLKFEKVPTCPWRVMKQTCSCGLPPLLEVFAKFGNNSLNAESQLVTKWNILAVRSSMQEILAYCNFLQFNTLHGATPPVQWCSPALMMTDHHTIGVMPVSKRTRQQKPHGHGSRVVNAL